MQARNLAEFGVHVSGDVTVDFGQVMLRMRQLRAKISAVDACSRFRDELGIDVFQVQQSDTIGDLRVAV